MRLTRFSAIAMLLPIVAMPAMAQTMNGAIDMHAHSDLALLMGLLVYYGIINRPFYVVLTAIVMTASVMVSYTRARAENTIPSCKVGFMERPERIVCVILGALCNRWGVMAPALWVLALFSTITVIHRIRYTYLETERRKLQPQG